jgi:hypothetical protein
VILPAAWRRFSLTAHIVASVGWLGAVGVFLALAVVGLTDGSAAPGLYAAMDVAAWYVILPLAFAALATGLLVSLASEWGLLRHYWVIAKLVIAVLSTLLLILHMEVVSTLAAAGAGLQAVDHLRPLRVQMVANAALALVALIVAVVLSVYKPRGLTRYGQRKRRERLAALK